MTILDANVRSDLADAHRETIAVLGQAGDWLSSSERVALAEVTRAARGAADQPPWYRPSSEGIEFAPLPSAAVDAAWRLTNHPGTLTAAWYEETVAQLPSPEYYVELVGVVAAVNSVDRFAVALDVDVLPLPEPTSGEPARAPSGGVVARHWVPTDPDLGGANVLKALSISPSARSLRERLIEVQYLPVDALLGDMDWSRGTLDRRQIELVAAQTSFNNECFY
ncbi:MAG: hypothetical protein AAF567_20050 [Actinomycetota bacterium]